MQCEQLLSQCHVLCAICPLSLLPQLSLALCCWVADSALLLLPQKPKVKSTPWGSSYRAAPEILHGYTSKVCGPPDIHDSIWQPFISPKVQRLALFCLVAAALAGMRMCRVGAERIVWGPYRIHTLVCVWTYWRHPGHSVKATYGVLYVEYTIRRVYTYMDLPNPYACGIAVSVLQDQRCFFADCSAAARQRARCAQPSELPPFTSVCMMASAMEACVLTRIVFYCLFGLQVTGKNASERLDMRAATKADKFCK